MTIVTLRSTAPTNYARALATNPDADFDRRWAAWTARGLAHDTLVRQRFIALAVVAGTFALAAVIAYGMFSM
jgi:hypothetical protein